MFVKLTPCRILAAAILFTASLADAQEPAGDWGGLLADQFHVVIHVNKNSGGDYHVEFRCPDQGDFVLEPESIQITKDHFGFSIPSIGASYSATWDATKSAWLGVWVQGRTLPLNLLRLDAQTLKELLKPKHP